MKWRRDTCLPRPSSFAHLKLARLPILAQGLREGSLRRRQFWSNICPRKNKSPLSLTTGRASLVSNRALLNRRRITDPRGRSIQTIHRFFLSLARSTSSPVVHPALDRFSCFFFVFFFHWQRRATDQDVARRRLALPSVFLSKILSDFYHRYFAPFFLSHSIVNRWSLGQTRLKSRVPTKNAGCRRGERLSRPNTSLGTHRDFANLSRFLPSSFFR